MVCDYVATATQPANNHPLRWKNAYSGIPTRVHHRLPRLTLYQCRLLASLGSLPSGEHWYGTSWKEMMDVGRDLREKHSLF